MIPIRLNRNVIYESDWVNLYTDKVQLCDGKIIEEYHYLHYPNESVCAVLENDSNELLLIKSNRYVTGREEWEVPAGRIEDKETIEQALIREVKEETGYEINDFKYLCNFNPNNGMSNLKIHAYYVKVGRKTSDYDHNEVKDICWFSKDIVKDMIFRNEIQCGVSLLALLFTFQYN